MAVAVGVDVAKEFHWAALVHAETGTLLASRRVDNDPPAVQALIDDIRAAEVDHGPATVAIDVLGGIAGRLQVMLLEAGLRLVHVSGLAVNRARQATRGGEHKSDPRDAKVIADQIRLRGEDLRPVEPAGEADAQLRLLVGRRRELVVDQTRRIGRLRDLLASIHPGLERVIDATNKADLALLTRYVTPAEIRRAGRRRISDHLRHVGGLRTTNIDRLVEQALATAGRQHLTVPGEAVAADLVRDLAAEALSCRTKLAHLDKRIAEVLDGHPEAALIQSLPGMGAILTAEFLAVARRHRPVRHRRPTRLRRRPRAGPATIRQSALPAPRHQRRQDPQTNLLPIGVLRPATRPDQPRLLRPQTRRRQTTPPGPHRPGPTTHQRTPRHPAHPPALSNRSRRRGLTFALGCLHRGARLASVMERIHRRLCAPHSSVYATGGSRGRSIQ
jgi:transposase